MPLSMSFYHSKRGAPGFSAASAYQSVALHDRAKVAANKLVLPCEFYRNIWGPSEDEDAMLQRRQRLRTHKGGVASAASRRYKKRLATGPLIDIAQVAHVVTTMSDFRADYGVAASQERLVNLWDDRSLALGLEDSHASSHEDDIAPTTADTEPEEIMSPIHSRAARISEASHEDSDEASSVCASEYAAASSVVRRQRPGSLKRANTPVVVYPSERSTASSDAQSDVPQPQSPGKRLEDVKELKSAAVAAPSITNGSVVFSAVFTEPREWSWSAKFLLGVHEPIRHALFVMDRFLEQSYGPVSPDASKTVSPCKPSARTSTASVDTQTLELHVSEFFVWFKSYFVEYLRCQHEVKATVLLPLLSLPPAAKQEMLDVYRDIFQMLAQIQQLERALCVSGACSASSWMLRLDVLQKEIRQLNLTLHATLNLEETALHPALAAAFTERAFHSHVMPRVFRAIRAKRVVVPWIVERSKIWGGEAEQRSLQGLLPFSARFMYRKLWRPYFMSNVAAAMRNLDEFVDLGSARSSISGSNSNVSVTSSFAERQSELCTIM